MVAAIFESRKEETLFVQITNPNSAEFGQEWMKRRFYSVILFLFQSMNF